MLIRVIALLDRPSRQTSGMVPVVLAQGDQLVVHGLARKPPALVDQHELDELLIAGHGVAVSGMPEVASLRRDDAGNVAAGWLGYEWADTARHLDLCPFGIPNHLFEAPERGHFWLDSPDAIYAVLDRWLLRAAARAFTESDSSRSQEISVLMRRAMPHRRETQAVTYWTRADQAERAARLDFYVRRERDNGRLIAREALERELKAIRQNFLQRRNERRILDLPPIRYKSAKSRKRPLLSHDRGKKSAA